MENFDFVTACELITSRLTSGGGNPERVWRLYFPRMVYFEIEEAEAVQNILGLRRPVAVQQRVCRSFWKHCFKSEPLPWIEDPKVEKRTFGLGEEMEIALMKEVMTIAATGDTKAALAMLATNSMNPKKTDSKETAKDSVASKPKPAPAPPKPVPVLPKPAPVPSKPVTKPAASTIRNPESDSEPAKNLAKNPVKNPFRKPVENPFGTPVENPFGKPVENPFRNPFGKPSLPLENYSTERNKVIVKSSDKNTQQSDRRRRDDRSRSPSSSRSLTARRRSF
ncbi:hypothetical protein NUW58_g918 [Xylaria curta]|uniref:Uncharacterized protein n=1 Tax=Xylaria curta TaxID=42375 RepID=A0ACC1PNU1_9PEZI|nr:hypothetical protein NUW58_g918 [Xylaria curta]